jgi:hypothetical protein
MSHLRRPEFPGTMMWEPPISQDVTCWEEAVTPSLKDGKTQYLPQETELANEQPQSG